MNNFEFINYKSYPADPYTLGVATVKAYGKIRLSFKHVKKKDGGTFFCPATIGVTDGVEKSNVLAFMVLDRGEEEDLMEFVREGVKQYSAHVQSVSTAIVEVRQSGGGVAQEAQLPF